MSSQFDKSKKMELPVGGDFTPTGLIGPVVTARMYKFSSQVDLTSDENKAKVVKPDYHWKSGDWHFYYYHSQDDANAAAGVCETDFNAQQRWLLQLNVEDIMNVNDLSKLKEAWGATMTLETSVTTYRSAKYRHEFHLMALPAMVAAWGKHLGYDVSYDLSELMNLKTEFNDDFRDSMIGPQDMTMEEVFAKTVLGRRRAELWAALGEPNPMAYTSSENKFQTKAPKLVECLEPVEYRWTNKLLARLVSVPDPRVDAVNLKKHDDNGNPRRLLIPTLHTFFNDEAEAKAAAEEDKKRQEDNAKKKVGLGDEPPLPDAWKEYGRAEWMAAISEYIGKPLAPVLKKVDVAELGCTKEELTRWLQYFNLNS